jgi:hypothetical protein
MMKLLLAGLLAAAGAATIASADTPRHKNDDPNKMVCQMRAPIGSRLATIKECHTAAEWDEMRRQERLGLNRKQGNGDAGCNYNRGDPACGVRNGGKDTPW